MSGRWIGSVGWAVYTCVSVWIEGCLSPPTRLECGQHASYSALIGGILNTHLPVVVAALVVVVAVLVVALVVVLVVVGFWKSTPSQVIPSRHEAHTAPPGVAGKYLGMVVVAVMDNCCSYDNCCSWG